jgi:EAL domain-containing protein (putative c-di-GMP-specific phosphodiesterase class I)
MPLDVVSGYAEFHSSYMPHIQKCATKYGVDPAELIIEITKIDKVNLDPEVLEKVAKRIKKRGNVYLGKYAFNRYIGGEQDAKKS